MRKEEVLKILEEEKIKISRESGQNFLVNNADLSDIIKASGLREEDLVLEIGPGLGVLTQELLKNVKKVVAIEKDEKLFNYLEKRFKGDKIELINEDILKVDLDKLFEGKKYKVVANIPYYITGKIFKTLLSLKNKPELLVILVQKEVAQRVCAKKGNLSVLAISVQVFGECEIVKIVKNDSFWPSPEVDSAILKVKIDETFSSKIDDKKYFRIVKIAFSSRRKMILNNLKAGLGLSREEIEERLHKIGINPQDRAQNLDIYDFKRLYEEFEKEMVS